MLHLNGGLVIYLGLMAALGTMRASRPALVMIALWVLFDTIVEARWVANLDLLGFIKNFVLAELWPVLFIATNRYRRLRWTIHHDRGHHEKAHHERSHSKRRTAQPQAETGSGISGTLLHGRFRVIEGRS